MLKKSVFTRVSLVLLAISLLVSPAAAQEPKTRAQLQAMSEYLVGGIEPWEYDAYCTSSDFQYIGLDIYLTQDYDLARDLVQAGVADYVESNYIEASVEAETGERAPAAVTWPEVDMNYAYARKLGLDGTGIVIGVIDSGIDRTNPNLQGAHILEGKNFAEPGRPVFDGVGHGTNVAQTIVGNGYLGAVRGIAPKATLVPIQGFDRSGRCNNTDHLVQAILAAVDQFHSDIINMSWCFSLGTSVESLKAAIQYAYDQGVLLVSASGNVSRFYPQHSELYPSFFPEVVSVGNYKEGRQISSGSIQNSGVTVAAPGSNIPFIVNGYLQPGSGTSYASPIISGLAALVKQSCPMAAQADFLNLIEQKALDLGEPGRDWAYGYGALSVDAVFQDTWYELMYQELRPVLGGSFEVQEDLHGFAACYEPSGRMYNAGVFVTADNVLTMPQAGALGKANDNFQFLLFDAEGNFLQESMVRKAS